MKGFQIGHKHSEETKKKIGEANSKKVYFNCDYICNNLNTGNPFFNAFQSNISAEQARISTIVIIHQQ